MVSLEDFASLAQEVKAQSETIRLLRENLNEAGRKVIALEQDKEKEKKKESQKGKHNHVHFGKELCPESYDGKDASDFKHWRLKVANYLSNDEDDMAMEILDWAGKEKEEIKKATYDDKAAEDDWDEDGHHHKFSRMLYKFLMLKTTDKANRIVQNGEPGDGVDAWRRLVFQYDPNLASMSQSYLKMLLGIPKAKDANEAVVNIQKLEDYVRKYEKNRNKELDEEIKVQRIYDILPVSIEQHLVLENRDKEASYDDIKRRAFTWIMTNTTGKAPMIDSLEEKAEEEDAMGKM